MDKNFTLILLTHHYLVSQQFQIISYRDVSVDVDIANFMQAAEQQVSQQVLDSVYTTALTAIQ